MTSIERAGLAREATGILLEQLAISPVRNSSLVDASFTTPSPGLSSKLAHLLAQQFLQASIDRRFAATSDARKYLEGRLNPFRQNLATSERALITTRKSTPQNYIPQLPPHISSFPRNK